MGQAKQKLNFIVILFYFSSAIVCLVPGAHIFISTLFCPRHGHHFCHLHLITFSSHLHSTFSLAWIWMSEFQQSITCWSRLVCTALGMYSFYIIDWVGLGRVAKFDLVPAYLSINIFYAYCWRMEQLVLKMRMHIFA